MKVKVKLLMDTGYGKAGEIVDLDHGQAHACVAGGYANFAKASAAIVAEAPIAEPVLEAAQEEPQQEQLQAKRSKAAKKGKDL